MLSKSSMSRRTLLRTIPSFGIGLAGCLSLGQTAVLENNVSPPDSRIDATWTQYRRDAGNTGATNTEIGRTPKGLIWEYEPPTTLYSQPTIRSDTVYVSTKGGHLIALDAATGDEQWTAATDSHLYYSPAVTENTVLDAGSGSLFAFDAATGENKWEVNLTGQPTAVTLDGDRVYVGTSFSGDLYCVALDGETIWTRGSAASSYAPAVADGSLFFAHGSQVVALTDTGENDWSRDLGANVVTPPAIDSDTLYVGRSDGMITALSTSGGVLWSYNTEQDKGLYELAIGPSGIIATDGTGTVHAFDDTSGQRWTFDTDSDNSGNQGGKYPVYAPVVSGEYVFVLGFDESIYMLHDRGDGVELVANWNLENHVWATPVPTSGIAVHCGTKIVSVKLNK